MWETSVFLKRSQKWAVLCQMKNTWLKKNPSQAHCKVSFQCSILQSLPGAPYLVAKRHMPYLTPTIQHRDNKEKLITVILQAEKERSVTFTSVFQLVIVNANMVSSPEKTARGLRAIFSPKH